MIRPGGEGDRRAERSAGCDTDSGDGRVVDEHIDAGIADGGAGERDARLSGEGRHGRQGWRGWSDEAQDAPRIGDVEVSVPIEGETARPVEPGREERRREAGRDAGPPELDE